MLSLRKTSSKAALNLLFAVVNEKPHPLEQTGEAEVARPLCHPGTGRVSGAAREMDATTPKFDEEEHVEAAQRDRLDGEESQGSMLAACWRRNCRQLGPERLGAGPRPLPSKIRLTVLGDTRRPSLSSSPAIRGSPQRGFSQRSAVRAGESDRRRADGRGFDAVASTCAARAPGASVEASVA